jgi:putative transposase
MKKLTHSESEIVKSVNELESGVSADEICRRLNVSRATLYQWKRKYSGLEVSQLKLLKELEEENSKLKKMYANLALDNEILREVIEKKTLAPEARKEITGEIAEEFHVSITRACNLMVTKVLSGTINASTACTWQSTSASVFRYANACPRE